MKLVLKAPLIASTIFNLLVYFALSVCARTAEEWRSRTIYQLLTDRFAQAPGEQNLQLCKSNGVESEMRHYCGGTFTGIIDKLDYIKGMGFDAIWISPVVKQIEDETLYGVGWHGYWAEDLYAINPHFGTADELKQLVRAAHDKDVWVMVDVVANHMGPRPGMQPRTNEYVRNYNPLNVTTDYHEFCVIRNYDNQQEVEYCSLGGDALPLPDIDTENDVVISKLYSWIANLVNEYQFDGIRIDTVKHVRKTFWNGYTEAAGVFSIGEVFHGDFGYVAAYQQHMDSVLSFPLFEKLAYAYSNPSNNMYEMRNAINANRYFYKDTLILGNFIDCHDTPRFLSRASGDESLARNALTFVLLADGIPIVYQGTEQGFRGNPNVSNGGNDPWNREALWSSNYNENHNLYQHISTINAFRKSLPPSYFTAVLVEAWINEHIYAFMKDRALVITSNFGSTNPNFTFTIQGNGRWSPNTVLVNILECDETVIVDGNGHVTTTLTSEPKVFYPRDELLGVCGK